ncbi:hypothetical protein [Caulobacter sp. 17J65-9]|uniref:hypothetical protein n=1 Tax=Caulobacter sp. 17J65-9 TaxID=2709382 RepID=UPI0013C9E550|nr:hypothetical protein [Caulobacter sp. 17J65-9]NEX91173.1 hypothetical protein [Caulobacter sp. 17J65-9]
MNTITQAEKNKQQVVIEQLQQQVAQLAGRWDGLGRKEKIEAWADHALMGRQGVFHPFHRVLEVVEVIH